MYKSMIIIIIIKLIQINARFANRIKLTYSYNDT